MRTVVFVVVAVAGMALLPETPVNAGVGKDPATAYAPAGPTSPPAAQAPVTSFEIVARRRACTIEFTATKIGTFPIVCADACGDGPADMRGSLVVVAS